MLGMKSTLRTANNSIFVLKRNLSDSAATHRLEMLKMTSTFTMLHETILTMLKTMHTKTGAPSTEHQIVVEMTKSNRRYTSTESGMEQ